MALSVRSHRQVTRVVPLVTEWERRVRQYFSNSVRQRAARDERVNLTRKTNLLAN